MEINQPVLIDSNEKKNANNAKPNLTDGQRQRIYELLLQGSKNGKLRHGQLTSIAKQFAVNGDTVRNIWRRGQACIAMGLPCADVRSRIPKNTGKKKMDLDLSVIDTLPTEARRTLRELARYTNISQSTLSRACKANLIKKHKDIYIVVHPTPSKDKLINH